MKSLIIAAAMSLSLFSGQVLAHADHGPITQGGAMEVAARAVQKMTVRDFGYSTGQLDAGWKNIDGKQVSLKESGPGFYVVEITKAGSDEKVYVKVLDNGAVAEVSHTYPF
ncbi:MAG TPA: hypothetical protein DEA26_01530 [Oceanospirillales bacterium]|nr:hypothetical protein [Oceanospirillaceae bacterium]HBS41331.1 hypothetical protein [Oceanospirillales bacterium]|tara:strand:- start:715 stop:1047 length:333 start_codon:yes stop_codon:yes gene_type:complete